MPDQKKVIKKNGQVIEALPNATFRVTTEEGQEVLAHLSGKMRMNHIRVLVGDRVVVEISPYNERRGRITLRG